MGRGSGVRAASASSIQIDFRYKGQRCREKLKLEPTPANLKYAARLKATIEREITLGIFDYAKHFPDSERAPKLSTAPGAALTVGELLATWHKSIKGEVEPETWGDYDEAIRFSLAPAFGTKRLTEMSIRVVKDWAADQECGRKRLLNILTPLRRAFSETAIEDHYLDKDPLAGLRIKRVETEIDEDASNDDDIDPFTPAELATALPHADPQCANMFEVWAWTGLRTGEMIALTWADVDFERGILRVNKARRGRRLKTPKTSAGIREVRLLPPTIEALKRQRAYTQLIGREVFLNPTTQESWTGDKPVRNVWRAVLEAAKVRYRYPYQLRHTYASWMLSGGENPLWVAKQMGHKDWSQIVKTYGRWIPDVDPEAGLRAYGRIKALGTIWTR